MAVYVVGDVLQMYIFRASDLHRWKRWELGNCGLGFQGS